MAVDRIGKGFGRGKVILLGEHSVVHGHPALAAGIERGVTAKAIAATRDQLRLNPWDRTIAPDEAHSDPLCRALSSVLALYPERPALDVTADIALPAGAGLGCSAALGVAVIAAIDDALGVERSAADLGRAALVWESVFHGNPSGVDNMMAASGGLAVYTKGEPLERVPLRAPLQLVIAHSGETSSTKEMVQSVARQFEKEPDRIGQTFEAIASLVRNGRLACLEDDRPALGQLFDLNHFLLSSLMLCTTKLDQLCQAARSAGALGAKVTGAGGGGCMIALAPTHDVAQAVSQALSPLASEVFIAEVAS